MATIRNLTWLLALVAIAGACSKKPKASHSCGDRLDRFADHLDMAASSSVASVPPGDFQSIRANRGSAKARYGPTLEVSASGQHELYGQPVAKTELSERLTQELERWRSLPDPAREASTMPLLIWFDRRADSVLLAQLKLAVPDGIEPMVLAVGESAADPSYRDELLALDAVAEFRRDMDAADPSGKATMVARRVSDLIEGRCQPLVDLFGTVAGHDAADKGTFIAEGTVPALRKCKCDVYDMPLLEYIMLTLLGVFDGPIHALTVDDALALLPPASQTPPVGTTLEP